MRYRKRVGYLASRQIQVRPEPRGDRQKHIFQACFLTKHRQRVGLASLKARDTGTGLGIVDIGNGDVEADGHPRFGYNPCLAMDDGVGVAVVGDSLEVDVAKPSSGLSRAAGKPCPVCVIVEIKFAVRLPDVPGSDNGVVQAAPMDAPTRADGAVELLSQPAAIPVSGRRIEPIGIDLG